MEPKLKADGDTPMGRAIKKALEIIQDRKVQYQANGIAYYRPWVFMITDGAPTDDWHAAAQAIRDSERDKAVAFFPVGVDQADMGTLVNSQSVYPSSCVASSSANSSYGCRTHCPTFRALSLATRWLCRHRIRHQKDGPKSHEYAVVLGRCVCNGSSHVQTGTGCQDAFACKTWRSPSGADTLIAVVADGAGSAERADAGAETVTECFVDTVSSVLSKANGMSFDAVAAVRRGVEQARLVIALQALEEGRKSSDFSCTIVGCLVHPDGAVFGQIGDGAAVYALQDEDLRLANGNLARSRRVHQHHDVSDM